MGAKDFDSSWKQVRPAQEEFCASPSGAVAAQLDLQGFGLTLHWGNPKPIRDQVGERSRTDAAECQERVHGGLAILGGGEVVDDDAAWRFAFGIDEVPEVLSVRQDDGFDLTVLRFDAHVYPGPWGLVEALATPDDLRAARHRALGEVEPHGSLLGGLDNLIDEVIDRLGVERSE